MANKETAGIITYFYKRWQCKIVYVNRILHLNQGVKAAGRRRSVKAAPNPPVYC